MKHFFVHFDTYFLSQINVRICRKIVGNPARHRPREATLDDNCDTLRGDPVESWSPVPKGTAGSMTYAQKHVKMLTSLIEILKNRCRVAEIANADSKSTGGNYFRDCFPDYVTSNLVTLTGSHFFCRFGKMQTPAKMMKNHWKSGIAIYISLEHNPFLGHPCTVAIVVVYVVAGIISRANRCSLLCVSSGCGILFWKSSVESPKTCHFARLLHICTFECVDV